MEKLKKIALELLANQHFDTVAVGVIDFKTHKFESFEITATDIVSEKPYLYYDLASMTKPLTNSSVRLKQPELFDEKTMWLLNHIAGLPSGGLLSKKTWREEILAYEPKLSPVIYSDYSSLRCMLEIEKKSGKKLRDLCTYYFDPELIHWRDLPENSFCPEYGVRNKKIICGQVHDNNSYNIGEFISHAGLFGTVGGVCRSLISLDKVSNLTGQLKDAFKIQKAEDRYILGFDRIMDPTNTLAGNGCSNETFGHLGFVGTSFWIDLKQMKGAVILSNGVQTYWYDKAGLNEMRRTLGEAIWKM